MDLNQLRKSIADLTEKLDQTRWRRAPSVPIVRIGLATVSLMGFSWIIFGESIRSYIGREGAKVSSEILKAPSVKKDATQLVKDVATDPSTQISILKLVEQINENPVLMNKLSDMCVSVFNETIEKVQKDPVMMSKVNDFVGNWIQTTEFSKMIQDTTTIELEKVSTNPKNQELLRNYFMASINDARLKESLASSLREVVIVSVTPNWFNKN